MGDNITQIMLAVIAASVSLGLKYLDSRTHRKSDDKKDEPESDSDSFEDEDDTDFDDEEDTK